MYTKAPDKKPTRKERGSLRKFGDHLGMLLYKQVMVMVHRWPTTLIRLLWPVVLVLIWKGTVKEMSDPAPSRETHYSNIPRCTSMGPSCITILYSNNTSHKKKSIHSFFFKQMNVMIQMS